jgi:FkbM family methyltransferase
MRGSVHAEDLFRMICPSDNSSGNPLRLPLALRLLQRVEFPGKLGACGRIFGQSLSKAGICWVRTAPGPVWKLDLANPTHRWIVFGYYEGPSLWRWMRARAGTIRTVVDSGANIGQTVLYFATYLPQARILAYEPGRTAREWLAAGIAANGFNGIRVEPAGLSSSIGSARLGTVGGDELHGAWNQISASEGDPIALVSLDDELERQGVASVDLWKLDVEGHELEALRGAARALAARRIRAIYMEMGEAHSESTAFLGQFGYTGWTLRNSGRAEPLRGQAGWGNGLFLAPASVNILPTNANLS